ncbi:sensor histidine kinase [Aquimarina algicola]|uniref:histidine kinase n=1 Tax=Aquimarina algicola TaxID=2589995 RepID=A0A504JNG5_9FLAO|nr:HAMP domain-containing sensor histidine kinase [Aquimarina algicola]TPN89273.1 HAMP domain-containing histidine kinase [Aquimarina algicola]
MKSKINILIITSIFVLLALSGIQGYLIYNSYQLKKEAFIKESKEIVSDIIKTEKIDSLSEHWYENLVENITNYKKNKILKSETIQKFEPFTDSLNTAFKEYYQNKISNANLEYEVEYKKIIRSIVLYDNDQRDTIFYKNENDYYFLFGENFFDKDSIVVSRARWFTEQDYEEKKGNDLIPSKFNLEIRTEDQVSIKDWKQIVLGQMIGIFSFSILLLVFVIVLLFYSITTVIKQKKIADIRNDFINNITHELKTPLATLGIASKSLRNENIKNSPELYSNTLDIVDRQNNRLQNIIDQVLNNTLSAERLSLNPQKILDNDYFKEVIEDFKLSIKQKEFKISTHIEPKEVLLNIDRFLFTTALFNIMDNAVKYGGDRVKIKVNTSLKNNIYEIKIQDNGAGIEPKEQSQIFEKFYRVSKGNVHEIKGLGLGLFYTQQVVKAHQGKIKVDSIIHQGTTFTITIPIH